MLETRVNELASILKNILQYCKGRYTQGGENMLNKKGPKLDFK